MRCCDTKMSFWLACEFAFERVHRSPDSLPAWPTTGEGSVGSQAILHGGEISQANQWTEASWLRRRGERDGRAEATSGIVMGERCRGGAGLRIEKRDTISRGQSAEGRWHAVSGKAATWSCRESKPDVF